MATRRVVSEKKTPTRRPATTIEGREGQLVNLAVDLAEKQMRDGTASAQVVSHYLKMGSTRERLEQQRLERENELLKARVESLASAKNVEKLYAEALDAMRTYAGHDDVEYDEYEN